ncbi:FadR/GntR family transcriptional regulator [Microbacterium murale]|uniref:GntR family transcriptional repressor for pyruvate dehydrogenase complex n=1 Tax=Microbacterium murale TaxID=1081040 RepID=A0ABU0P5U6_9MICO|nr:FadR/GntR family transcriptional regulator [Microbacterium murale]MDQ0642694.1 GntR family transcriptional repressor for pyruvate dehydrogenase complex [Microbacterium murale]
MKLFIERIDKHRTYSGNADLGAHHKVNGFPKCKLRRSNMFLEVVDGPPASPRRKHWTYSDCNGYRSGKRSQGARMPAETDLEVARIRPAYDQVASQLKLLILNGSLAPGERLPAESSLAAAFGVSRNTVREALRMLSSAGLVRTERGVTGGTFVAQIELDDVSEFLESRLGLLVGSDSISPAELTEARIMLEVPCARQAALRRSEEDLDELQTLVDAERDDRTGWSRGEHSHEFHLRLLRATGNTVLELMLAPVLSISRPNMLQPKPGTWDAANDDHARILDAVRRRDAEEAARLTLEHLHRVREINDPNYLGDLNP